MDNPIKSNSGAQARKTSPLVALILIPALSCMVSSMAGIILGQAGNLVYAALGQVSACLTVPGFFLLFGTSFGLSFLVNKLLQRLFSRPKDLPVS